jgi:hypothetical protein
MAPSEQLWVHGTPPMLAKSKGAEAKVHSTQDRESPLTAKAKLFLNAKHLSSKLWRNKKTRD